MSDKSSVAELATLCEQDASFADNFCQLQPKELWRIAALLRAGEQMAVALREWHLGIPAIDDARRAWERATA